MVKKFKSKSIMFCFVLLVFFAVLLNPQGIFAIRGDCGYEGGISSGQRVENSNIARMEYQEVCFVSGQPFVLWGELEIRTIKRPDATRKIYTYTLENLSMNAILRRTVVYDTKTTEKDGQVIEDTILGADPSEVIRIGNKIYTLDKYEMSLSNLIDKTPATQYFAGNLTGKKTYLVGNLSNGGRVTIEVTGNLYGYDQIWSKTETCVANYTIQSTEQKGEVTDIWGGTGKVVFSSSIIRQIKYDKNEPDQISFPGGFVEESFSSSILEYSFSLPEFDADGISTDRIVDINDTLKMESFPIQRRLPVPNLNHLRGHWAENDIKALFSLEIIKGDPSTFNPAEAINREEFTVAMLRAIGHDNVIEETPKTNLIFLSLKKEEKEVESPFIDVPSDSQNFKSILKAYEIGLINGKGYKKFAPDDYLTVADAITIFIRAVGLEGLAPNPGAVTRFKDNDEIPSYARNAVYVAQRIGLVQGDDRGYIHPNEYVTKEKAAALINRFISYMQTGIRKDYTERLINY